MNTLVLGLGNSILKDDGAGPAVINELRRFPLPSNVALETTNQCGMPLLDILAGYDTLIIVDALQDYLKPGETIWLGVDDFVSRETPQSQHHMDILRMLEIGRTLDLNVPADVKILAIGTKDIRDFGEGLSPGVKKAVPEAAGMIVNKIREMGGDKLPYSLLAGGKKILDKNRGVKYVENK